MSPLPSLSTCVKLTINGAAADLANKSPDGTALFQIASHCSGFRAAEGRPDVMVFACASTQVAVRGSTTKEMIDALNICLLPTVGKPILAELRPGRDQVAHGLFAGCRWEIPTVMNRRVGKRSQLAVSGAARVLMLRTRAPRRRYQRPASTFASRSALQVDEVAYSLRAP